MPVEQQNFVIPKPLPSNDVKTWLKDYPNFHPFLEALRPYDVRESLFGLLIAGNFAGQAQLSDLIGCEIAAFCIGKSVETLREYFDVESDFTPEEDAWHKEELGFAMQLFWVKQLRFGYVFP